MNIPVQSDRKAFRYERMKISSPYAPVSANRLEVQNDTAGLGTSSPLGMIGSSASSVSRCS